MDTRTLALEYLTATEWSLATLSGLFEKKRTPKHEIARQRTICVNMIRVCYEAQSNVPDLHHLRFLSRVQGILRDCADGGEYSVTGAIDKFIEAQK